VLGVNSQAKVCDLSVYGDLAAFNFFLGGTARHYCAIGKIFLEFNGFH
jgi:hypothetical protein